MACMSIAGKRYKMSLEGYAHCLASIDAADKDVVMAERQGHYPAADACKHTASRMAGGGGVADL